MERARHRKTKSASGIEGIRHIQKQKAFPRLSSDSRSYIDGSNRDDMFMLELGQRSVGVATGIPMKKLLAEEMSKDVEAKRRSPSIIAKLMGLEGLPSPRHVQRQHKRISGSPQPKNVSNNLKNNQMYDGRSNRRSSTTEQQEFKDVYEDLEASHVADRRCSSRWSANSILTKPEMAFIRQKFIDAKRLSTDENLQNSKELDDTLEMLDSNKDLLLKFLGQPDIFMKHIHDPQVDTGSSLGSHIAVLKPVNSEKYESKSKAWRSDKDTSGKPFVDSHLKRKDGLLLEPHIRHRTLNSRNSTRILVEEENEEKILPTRIVVLKPNLGKMQNTGTSCSSPSFSQDYPYSFKKPKEYASVGDAETMSMRRKDSPYNVGPSKTMSKEAREIAREITMRMREGYEEPIDAKSTGYRGYVGDESSYDPNESDSESESEMFKLPSRRSFDDGNLRRYSSPRRLDESSANREAKKRLSERWKMTQKYQDLEMVNRGSTLGEMLSLPDREIRPHHLNARTNPGKSNSRPGRKSEVTALDVPLGISSRDGWKDEVCRNSSRSRSVPPSTGGRGRILRRSSYHDKLSEEKNLVHSDSARCGRNKVSKGNPSAREDSSPRDSRSRNKKSHSCQHTFTSEIGFSSEANFEIQMEPNTKDLSEQQSTFKMPEKDDTCEIHEVDVMMISERESTTVSLKSPTLLQKQSPLTSDSDKAASHNEVNFSVQELHRGQPMQGSPSAQCLGTELDSTECCKEAEHPSPVSVLEFPFTEDTSSSESFERVSAELHELRMQLQLLKMESGTYAESSTLLPIDEEEVQPSPIVSERNYPSGADNWKYSYAFDVLIHFGFEESNFDIFRTTWHSTDSPLDPKLFENLEKKYNDEEGSLRPERRFLFGQINSTLLEIFEDRVDSCPWVMPNLGGSNMKVAKEEVHDALEKLINEEHGNKEISHRELDREMLWSDSKGEIEMLGNEIEKLLMDDMIIEVVCN